ncbi:hypothetical protein [Bacillus cereus]|uniref:hypothetical protein n=1 Tax=Bacillus cereus TaxID=1396 RepID=UPI0018F4569F|nr:hypothetical protein [Bacillus cereus]MBJ7935494.1 hypothetical protein [Bacillus cereus]
MSHFTVMVQIPKEEVENKNYLERIMNPFDENKEVDPYVVKTKEELVSEYNNSSKTEEMSYDEWLKYRYSYDQFDVNGNLLSTYNPKSQWDWWVVGGRWSNLLLNKEGNKCDSAYVGELDLQAMKDKNIKNAKKNWSEMQKQENNVLKALIYGFRKDETEEEYINRNSEMLSTYAVIDKEGNWIAKGDMGWFGVSSETDAESDNWDDKFVERFIEPLDEKDAIVIIDCHI